MDGYKSQKAYAVLTISDINAGHDDIFWKNIVSEKITTVFIMAEKYEELKIQIPKSNSEIKFKDISIKQVTSSKKSCASDNENYILLKINSKKV